MQSLNYSTRELRMFRSLNRSRDFENNMNWNINSKIDNKFSFVIYGNIGAITSEYRTDIRNFFQEFLKKNKDVEIQISFFPGKFSRTLSFSPSFKDFSSVFKSGSFKMIITFNQNSSYSENNKIIYEFISNFLVFVKNQGKSISFVPYIISFYSFSGNINYYRIQDYKDIIKTDFDKKNLISYPLNSVNTVINSIDNLSKKNVVLFVNIINNIIFTILFSFAKKEK